MNVAPLFSSSDGLPIVITPGAGVGVDRLQDFLRTSNGEVGQLLQQHGGILFRGFNLNGAADFSDCAIGLGATPFTYTGGNTPRSLVAPDVFTSTEYPASETIGLHNEMSYLPEWPKRLLFYSLVPARQGGQTSLASSGSVLRALPADLVAKFRSKGLTYLRHFHANLNIGKSWQATYNTAEPDELERIIERQHSTCTWLDGGVLRVTTTLAAVLDHPATGTAVWFNQAEQWHPSSLPAATRAMYEELMGARRLPHDCEYGDGEPLADGDLDTIRGVLDAQKLLFTWRRNDLLVIDNVLMMHGRERYSGERRTLAYLSAS